MHSFGRDRKFGQQPQKPSTANPSDDRSTRSLGQRLTLGILYGWSLEFPPSCFVVISIRLNIFWDSFR